MSHERLEHSSAELERLRDAIEQTRALYEGAKILSDSDRHTFVRNGLMLNYIHALRAFNEFLLDKVSEVEDQAFRLCNRRDLGLVSARTPSERATGLKTRMAGFVL